MHADAYIQKLEAAFSAALNAGMIDRRRTYNARIAHDAWCPFLTKAGPCTCDPSIFIIDGPEDETS